MYECTNVDARPRWRAPRDEFPRYVRSLSFSGKTAEFDTGSIGGWIMSAGNLAAPGIILDSNNDRILVGSATGPMTGVGGFWGDDGAGGYDFRVGDPAGDYMHFDASLGTLEIAGLITADAIVAADTFTADAIDIVDPDDAYPRSEVRVATGSSNFALLRMRYMTSSVVAASQYRVEVDDVGTMIEIDGAAAGPLHASSSDRATVGTGEDTLETITIPAAAMADESGLRITAGFRVTGTNSTKTIRVRLDGTVLLQFGPLGSSEEGVYLLDALIMNNGSTTSQRSHGTLQRNLMVPFVDSRTSSVDTFTGDVDLTITGSCLNAGDEVQLESVAAHFVAGMFR